MSAYYLAFIFLLAAVLAVPIAKRLGLGSVLGYLLAGVIVGPYVLSLVGEVSSDLMHVAELGVVMMLFVIGLELRPSLFWKLRRPILSLGGAQVGLTACAVALLAIVMGLSWQPALAIGLILAMSSTAIVLQSLSEKGLLKTPAGEASFAVLLFQDIAVIPLIAALPLLATLPRPFSGQVDDTDVIKNLPAWQHALIVLSAIAVLIFAGRYLLRPFFRFIASTGLREMFTAATLLLVLGIGFLMQKAGLSPALGSFLAGVLLAESEYRVQLETDIEPFKGLLLGLFFITVGASIDFSLIVRQPGTVALLVLAMLVVKFLVLLIAGRCFKLQASQNLLFAFALAQGGEFSFVLFSLSTAEGVLAPEVANLLIAAVALSMAAAPLLLVVNEKFMQPRFRTAKAAREPDVIDEHDNPVIVAGFGRFGHVVGRVLRANGFSTTVLDHDPEQVETLRRFGLKSFYGDASRLDLLHAAGATRARLLVLAIDDEAKTRHIIQIAQKHFPNLKIFARAASRQHAYELLRLDVHDVFRETFGSALDLSQTALRFLGVNEHRARRAIEIFREHDEASVRAMALLAENDDAAYVSTARQHNENLIRALQSDQETFSVATDEPDGSRASG